MFLHLGGEGDVVESDWHVYKYYMCRGGGTRENSQHIEQACNY